jgi:hypothetical protein
VTKHYKEIIVEDCAVGIIHQLALLVKSETNSLCVEKSS